MKVCLYIRLSAADDDLKWKAESESITNQRALLTQYLKKHREFYPYEIIEFVDDGFSGTNGNRPAFERLIAFLRDGGSKLVLCKDLSRFFRNYVEIGEYLERIFPVLGVRLIAVNDNYDSEDYKGTTGSLDVVLRCIIYAAYSRDISQKTKSAMAMRIRKGQFVSSIPPYGYLRDPEDKHHLVPDPVAAKIVCRIFELALEGRKTSEIARILNADHVETPAAHYTRLHPDSAYFKKSTAEYDTWTSKKVSNILKRQEYTGALVSGRCAWKSMDRAHTRTRDQSEWLIIPDCHEAIVTPKIFQEAQQAIKKCEKREGGKDDYLLRSLVHCGCCGLTLKRAKGRSGVKPYYVCRNSYAESTSCPRGEHFPEAELERLVIRSLSELLQLTVDEGKRLRETAAKMQGTAENLLRNIGRIEQSQKKLSLKKMEAYEQYAEGRTSRDAFQAVRLQVLAEMETLQCEKEEMEKQLSELKREESPEQSRESAEAESFLKAENITNEMLLHFIERVDVFTGMQIRITYRFRNPFEEQESDAQSEWKQRT